MQGIAFDQKTTRHKDVNGFLHVGVSNIGKADVNPYFGREIPNFRSLGLDAGKIYYMLRHPDEMAKAAATMNNLPILDRHVPISAALPAQDEWIGSTGTDNIFNGRYWRNSTVIWKQDAIDDIEDEKRIQWSPAYHYRADMTPGQFNGLRYDGIMRDIRGNHLCLVETGRAGADVAVGDSIGEHNMKRTALLALAATSVMALIAPKLAMDEEARAADPITEDDIVAALEKIPGLAMDADDKPADDDEDCDGDSDEVKAEKAKRRAAKAKPPKPAMDTPPPPPPGGAAPTKEKPAMDQVAMDAAISKAKNEAVTEAKAAGRALRAAEKAVFPLVGEVVAMDSAEDVYRFALGEAGVSVEGVDPSAFPALVTMAVSAKTGAKPAPAMDHKTAATSFRERFPNAVAPIRS